MGQKLKKALTIANKHQAYTNARIRIYTHTRKNPLPSKTRINTPTMHANLKNVKIHLKANSNALHRLEMHFRANRA